MIKITEKVPQKEEVTKDELAAMIAPVNDIRTVALFGDVDEEKASDLCMGFLLLTDYSQKEAPYDPITFYISTYGGSADEMFSIYDMMSVTKTKVGRHCRIMIHAVAAGSSGELHNIENEVKSIKHIQELYINALSKETHMTKRMIQKLLDRKVNVYLSAEEAVEYGIADEIIN